MSTATAKRTHAQARADAEAFRTMFPVDSYARWEIAGSIRRKKPDIADIEHVVIPQTGMIDIEGSGSGLFRESVTGNLLWHCLEKLVSSRTVTKHIYGGSGPRWGELYRGVDFRGSNHEIFTADELNWGSQLTIRTGPAEFSQRMVMKLKCNGYRQWKHGNNRGYVFPLDYANELERSPASVPIDRARIVPAPDEETFFKLCGMQYIPPQDRR